MASILNIALSGRVRQFAGIPELVGRQGRVEEYFRDEKGNVHCRVITDDDDWFWCPASLLEPVQIPPSRG